MMFGEPSSGGYGTHHAGNSRQEASLRNRPPARASPTSDFLFSHPSADEFPYPPYSELPFTSLKRRKQLGNQFVKWTMRGILASPLIVLVLWSIGTMIFSKNVTHRTNNARNNRMNPSSNSMRRMADNNSNMGQQPLMQPYMMMPANQMPQQMNGMAQNSLVAPSMPYGNSPQTQQQMMMPQHQMGQIQMPQVYGVMQPQQLNGMGASQQGFWMMPPRFRGATENEFSYQMNPLMAQDQESPVMQQSEGLVVAPPQALQGEQQLQQQQQGQPVMQQQPLTEPAMQQQQQQNQMMQAESVPEMQQQQPLGATPLANPASTSTGATVLYYDPKQTVTGPDGQVRLPNIVYDAQGNPVDLVQLASRQGVQILLEPPLGQTQDVTEPQMTQSSPKRTLAQETPKSQMAVPEIKKWGESTAQDQSIIVSTVAVMALLVGALSARRLRSRNVLSVCIENESLEDDLAYDAAYSTTISTGDRGSSYNTFGGGWKGDLEKFDV